jgi:hypothetical protein
MSYTLEDLDKYGVAKLKSIYLKIIAHKSALSPEEIKKKGSNIKLREDKAKQAKRVDLTFDRDTYNELSREKKKLYLIKKIMEVEPTEEIGHYKELSTPEKPVYYKGIFERGGDIDQRTGKLIHAHQKEPEPEHIPPVPETEEDVEPEPEPVKTKHPEKSRIKKTQEKIIPHRKNLFIDAYNEFQDLEHQMKTANDPYSISETQKEMVHAVADMHKYKNMKDKDEHIKLKHSIHSIVKSFQKEMEDDVYGDEEISEVLHSLKNLKKLEPDIDIGSDILDKEISLFEGRVKAIEGQRELAKQEHFERKQEHLERKEEHEPMKRHAEQPVEELVESSVHDSVELKPKSMETQAVQYDSQQLTSKGDKNIGNVRTIGFLGPMEELAKQEDVITDESERSKSLNRFTNFRWVASIQNSSLGYASPFQRLQDIEDRRRYNRCFMPKNKMPKPEPDEIELEKHKNFNKYELVPSYSLSSVPQPATEFSFKTSHNPLARKVNIDEKQFGDRKLYNFECDGRPNINPHNPFSSSYGMERYDQSNKNQNPRDNTLEFSSVLYLDDPLKRKSRLIRNHLSKTKLFYS